MTARTNVSATTSSTAANDRELEAVVCEISEKLDSGASVQLCEYEQRHPEFAERLRQIWPTLLAMAELGHSPAEEHDDADDRPALVGTLGDFQLIREVGRGGMGVVYEARQISLERPVALKVLPFASVMDKRALQRFKNEALAAAALDHPNIVNVHSTGCERSVHYYAMHFVDGLTLAEIISQRRDSDDGAVHEVVGSTVDDPRRSSPPQGPPAAASAHTRREVQAHISTARSNRTSDYFRSVAEIGRQAAEALDYAHGVGVVHRDVKPSNLMLDDDGKCWVTDFGLAMIESSPNLTMTGDLLGTLRYMSPEQALAKRVVVDHRTDVYSLGVTLYELLTLRPAHAGEDRQELLRQLAFEEPTPPRKLNSSIPNDLETIVLKAIAKNPADRYATAAELSDDLGRYLEHRPILARRTTIAQYVGKWARRQRKPILLSASVLLAASIIGVGLLEYNRSLLKSAVKERDSALAELGREKLELDQVNSHLQEAVAKLEDQNTYLMDRQRRVRAGLGSTWELNKLITDYLLAGRTREAVEFSQRRFVETIQLLKQTEASHAVALAQLLPAYQDGQIPRAKEVKLVGRRFGRDSNALAPSLLFDGSPPITIEAIYKCDEIRDEPQNLLAWTSQGGISLCSVGDSVAGQRWAFWLCDQPGQSQAYTRVVSNVNITSGLYQHIAGVWDGEEARIYIDGRFQAAKPINREQLQRRITSHPLQIGADPNLTYEAGELFYGVLAAARVTAAALYTGDFTAPQELQDLDGCVALYDFRYDDGDYAYDRSGNGHHALLANVEKVSINPSSDVRANVDVATLTSEGQEPNANDHLMRGRIEEGLEHFNEALAEYSRASELNPSSIEAVIKKASLLRKLNRHAEAAATFEEALALDEHNIETLCELAEIRGALGQIQQGHDAFARALEIDQESAEIYYRRAKYYMNLGKWQPALDDFKKTVELDPELPRYWNPRDWVLGDAYYNVGRFEEAIEAHSVSVSRFPDLWISYHSRAAAFYRLQRWEEAVDDFTHAFELDRTDINHWKNWGVSLGDAYLRLGREDEALRHFDQGVELFPEDLSIIRKRAEALCELGRWDDALLDWELLVELAPRRLDFVQYRALALLGGRKDLEAYREQCAQALQPLAEGESGERRAYFLAWMCALVPQAVSDLGPVVAAAEADVEKHPKDRERLENLGVILMRAGRMEESIDVLRQYISLAKEQGVPPHSLAYSHYFLAMAHAQLGAVAEAQAWLDKASELSRTRLEDDVSPPTWRQRMIHRLFRDEAAEMVSKAVDSAK